MQRASQFRFLQFLLLLWLACVLVRPSSAEVFKNPSVVLTGSSPESLAQADFNGDGTPDLVFIDGSGLHILLGNGDGTFRAGQIIPLPAGMGGTITLADVNADGKLDLVFGGSNPQLQVAAALGNGDGTFDAPIVTTISLNLSLYANVSARFGVTDVNGDGAVDLIVSDILNTQIYILLGNNTGAFTLGSAFHINSYPGDVSTGDFNGDGHADFLVQSRVSADVTVYLGNGDGTFQPGVVYGGGTPDTAISSMVMADMDGDGHPDLVVGTNANTVEILHGNPDGTFATTSSGGATLNSYVTVIAVADFNSDGILDIAVNDGSGLTILLGTGNLSYANPVPYSLGALSYATAVADFNRDGHPDVALSVSGGIALLFGSANGTLQSYAVYDMGQGVASLTVADLNGDHIPDIAVAEGSAGPGILIGKGDGTFTLKAGSSISQGTGTIVLPGDFNGDGKEDLYFTADNSSGLVLFGNGDATFNSVSLTLFQQVGFVAAAAGDLNNDGRTDLVSLNYQSFDVLLGQANETFKLVTNTVNNVQSSVNPVIADFNKDGKADLLVPNLTTIQVFLGNGDGTFTPGRITSTQIPGVDGLCGPTSMAAADLDGDGNLDVVAAISCNNVAEILYGNGDGTFQNPVVLPLEQGYNIVQIADLNGDHLPDLIFSNQGIIAIIHNAGHRTYSAESHYLAGTVGTIAIQDLNGDGFPDLVVASSGTTVAVLLNQPTGNLTSGVLTVSPEPSTITKPFAMTLTLAPFKTGTGTPTGTVTFSIDGNPVATVPLSGASASYTYAGTLSLGAHAIWATYNGDANFVPSYFVEQHQIIPIVHTTTITLTAAPTTVLAGQTISFHATVKSAGQVPYGIVSFLDGTTPIGSQVLDANSLAVFDTSLLSPGKHSISADFLGNQEFAAVKSSAVSVTVNVNQTAAKLSANPASVAVGAPVTLTASITSTAGTPAGSAIFYDGGTFLQNVTLDGTGVAVYGATFSTAGTHVITASFPANGGFAASNASAVNVTVTSAAAANATLTTIVGTANPQVVRGYAFSATVRSTNGKPSGNVVFRDGDSDLATVELDNTGSATYNSTSLGPGVHYMSAAYPGVAGLAGSVSTVLSENIPAEMPDFSMKLSPADSLVLTGGSVRWQVTVQPVNGFNQDIRLTCSTGTALLNCSMQSASLPNGAGTSMLTITRASTSSSALGVPRIWMRMAAGITLPLLLALPFTRRKRARILVVFALLGASLSCGISTKPATTSGYIVIVTGLSQQTNGVIIHTASLKVEVPSRPARTTTIPSP
jgi:hypothetical protein